MTHTPHIDLNSDLGEHYGAWHLGDDSALLDIVTSANIPCGFHAGDPVSLRSTLSKAAARGVTVGAHVSYPDLVGFGRRYMALSPTELEADVIYQIGALHQLATVEGTQVSYVKPHGALYNTIAADTPTGRAQADAVIAGILAVGGDLPLVCLAGSPLVERAQKAGLRVVQEAFADRNYEADGSLTSRREPDAVLHDTAQISDRMVQLILTGTLTTRTGETIHLSADSLCVHGDSPDAIDMARTLRTSLAEQGITIAPFCPTLETH